MRKTKFITKITALTLIVVMAMSTTVAFAETALKVPTITAKSAAVMDGDTGKFLYTKNSNTRRDPVSTTKLLTVLIAVERLDLDRVVTISKYSANVTKKDGSRMGLKIGEKLTVRDLVYGALLPSGNDAAVALARAVSGTTKKFAVLMNEKAKELGCTNSKFSNPHGWKASNHYSTARDMARITKAAMENEFIRLVCSTERYRVPKTNKQKSRLIHSTNSFVKKTVYVNSGVFAGKTGTWDVNNAALASACQRNGKVIYCVVLRDKMSKRYQTTNTILNYSYKKLKLTEEPVVEPDPILE
ncbi:D-alanyl-D-alanine carboxypeptidase [Clostridiales Family XIII bacterium PM5-7]